MPLHEASISDREADRRLQSAPVSQVVGADISRSATFRPWASFRRKTEHYNVLANRKPAKSMGRVAGGLTRQLAERACRASLTQEPPRITRKQSGTSGLALPSTGALA